MEKLDFTRGLIVTRGVLKLVWVIPCPSTICRLIVTRGVLKRKSIRQTNTESFRLIVTRGVLKLLVDFVRHCTPSSLIVTRGVLKQFFHFPILFRFRMFESNTRYIELRKLSISTWRARLDSAIKINRPFPLGLAYFTYINRVNLFKQINNENFIYKSILFGII